MLLKMVERKRIAGRAQNDDIEEWLNSQSNLNLSLNNVISHMIRIFGKERDITDYEVQEFLFYKISSSPFIQTKNEKKIFDIPNLNTIFMGPAGVGKTTALKRKIMEEREDFKVIICSHDEYLEEVKNLDNEGYKIETIVNAQFNEIPFTEQMRKASETIIEKNKLLYIITNNTLNGFDPQLTKKFFNHIYQKVQEKQVKVRIYIDGHVPFFNQLPEEICRTGRAYDFLVFAVFQSVSEIPDNILRQFYIHDVRREQKKDFFSLAANMTDADFDEFKSTQVPDSVVLKSIEASRLRGKF